MKIIYTGFDRFAATNVFTPNNDNRNDFFKPIDASCITAFEMKIYNRWGQLVYQTRNAQGNGWNGNDMSGNPTPIGVYYFIVSYKNVNDITLKQSGSITLLR